MSTDTPGARRVRASDTEREELAQILRAAMTEGRLSLEEGETRLAQAYAAVYRDELAPLTADLPGGGRWALFDTPEALAAGRRHLRGPVGLVTVIAAALITVWLLSGAHFFWPAIPLAFLAIGVLKHARYRHWCRHWQRAGSPDWTGRGWGPPWAGGWHR